MFIPSERHWQEMQNEPNGFWPLPINDGTESAFTAKIPTHLIKSVLRGAPVTMNVALARASTVYFAALELRIADDQDSPFSILGALRHTEEIAALKHAIGSNSVPFVFFDELSRPVARAQCAMEGKRVIKALTEIGPDEEIYTGPFTPQLNRFLDDVQAACDPSQEKSAEFSVSLYKLELFLSNFEVAKHAAIAGIEVVESELTNPEEGHSLEQSAWQLLASLFEPEIYHSPQVVIDQRRRQLSDVLAINEAGCLVVECKAVGALKNNAIRSSNRRASGVTKQIEKGLGQLGGAMRHLVRGLPLEAKNGERIPWVPGEGRLRVGLILVSELHPSVDWTQVACSLSDESRESGGIQVVLDLQELRLLVGISKDSTELLFHIVQRFHHMKEAGTAYIRGKVKAPLPP